MKKIVVDKERVIEIDLSTKKVDRICLVARLRNKGRITKEILLNDYSFEQLMEMIFD